MNFSLKSKQLLHELEHHIPFTLFGAITGILLMVLFKNLPRTHSAFLWQFFHPLHVLLSAMVTASLFKLRKGTKNIILIIIVGWIGSIGVATLSDSIIPFFGESILGVAIPTHDSVHKLTGEQDAGHSCPIHHHELHDRHNLPEHRLHIGFIEHWYIVNPAALIGIAIAWFYPKTKEPHALHVLVSTWASSAHILMNLQSDLTFVIVTGIVIVLFIAVWLPCCLSDIIFPLLFVKPGKQNE